MGIGKPLQPQPLARVRRSGERLIRLAYELDLLSARLRTAGLEFEANEVHLLALNSRTTGEHLDRMVRP